MSLLKIAVTLGLRRRNQEVPPVGKNHLLALADDPRSNLRTCLSDLEFHDDSTGHSTEVVSRGAEDDFVRNVLENRCGVMAVKQSVGMPSPHKYLQGLMNHIQAEDRNWASGVLWISPSREFRHALQGIATAETALLYIVTTLICGLVPFNPDNFEDRRNKLCPLFADLKGGSIMAGMEILNRLPLPRLDERRITCIVDGLDIVAQYPETSLALGSLLKFLGDVLGGEHRCDQLVVLCFEQEDSTCWDDFLGSQDAKYEDFERGEKYFGL
jgi:hypothetical protein